MAALLLSAAHFIGLAVAGVGMPDGINLNVEATVATWFSSVLHLANAGLLGILAASAPLVEQWRWRLLAVLVLGASIDEVAGLHEPTGWLLHRLLGTSGWLIYAWIIPAALVVAPVALLCTRLVLSRPGGVTILVGAAVFVGGAAGLEAAAGARIDNDSGVIDSVVLALAGAEETMEMLGAAIAMHGLLRAVAMVEPVRGTAIPQGPPTGV
jgi:hypothetical protein